MERARLIDFTARDAVKLFAKLYLVKAICDGIARSLEPDIEKWLEKLRHQREARKA